MNSVLQSAQVDALYQKLCTENEGHIVIAGVDELYQINAIRYKIQGFHRFLKENPAYGRVYRLVQVCYRQRSQAASVTRSRIYENQLREAANTCNADFPGSVDLRLLTGSFYPVEERMALWRVAKIYLNTALAQGLNLHPQEFLMARKKQGGIVIVSEFTNAHEFLNGALAVNPWNVESMVNELERATEMSNEEMRVCQQRDLHRTARASSLVLAGDSEPTGFLQPEGGDGVRAGLRGPERERGELDSVAPGGGSCPVGVTRS